MKRSVKILIVLNVLTYINNFLFSFVYTYANETLIKNWAILGIWVLSPYLFAVITSFILATDYKEEYKIFKGEAVFDWVIRCAACLVVFQDFNFKFLSFEYIVQQTIVVLLLVVNILLEFRLYKKAVLYVPDKSDYDKIEKISEDEKQNIKNMFKAMMLGWFSFFVFAAVGISVPSTSHVSSTLFSRLIPLIVSLLVFIWFLQANYKKCNLFYLDKVLVKRIFKRDSIYAAVGFIICFLTALDIFGTEMKKYSFYVTVIGALLLYPTIQTNRKISLRYKKVVKVLGDNFSSYFNCNDR